MSLNRLIEILTGPAGQSVRETPFNAPAIETENARLEQIGVFRDDSIGADQSAAAMTYQAIDAAAPVDFVPGRKGTLVGVVAKAISTTTMGAIAVGDMTVQPTVDGVDAGEAVVLDEGNPERVVTFATPVAFAALAELGVTLASESLSPTSSRCHVWLLVRWTPESAS